MLATWRAFAASRAVRCEQRPTAIPDCDPERALRDTFPDEDRQLSRALDGATGAAGLTNSLHAIYSAFTRLDV